MTTDDDDGRVIARLQVQIEHLTRSIDRYETQLATTFERLEKEMEDMVRLARFRPIELAVYGLISVLCSALLAAIVSKVLH